MGARAARGPHGRDGVGHSQGEGSLLATGHGEEGLRLATGHGQNAVHAYGEVLAAAPPQTGFLKGPELEGLHRVSASCTDSAVRASASVPAMPRGALFVALLSWPAAGLHASSDRPSARTSSRRFPAARGAAVRARAAARRAAPRDDDDGPPVAELLRRRVDPGDALPPAELRLAIEAYRTAIKDDGRRGARPAAPSCAAASAICSRPSWIRHRRVRARRRGRQRGALRDRRTRRRRWPTTTTSTTTWFAHRRGEPDEIAASRAAVPHSDAGEFPVEAVRAAACGACARLELDPPGRRRAARRARGGRGPPEPSRAPSEFVAELFDDAAPTFDARLAALGTGARGRRARGRRARRRGPSTRGAARSRAALREVGVLQRGAALVGVDLSAEMARAARVLTAGATTDEAVYEGRRRRPAQVDYGKLLPARALRPARRGRRALLPRRARAALRGGRAATCSSRAPCVARRPPGAPARRADAGAAAGPTPARRGQEEEEEEEGEEGAVGSARRRIRAAGRCCGSAGSRFARAREKRAGSVAARRRGGRPRRRRGRRASGRYAHATDYVEGVARAHGFRVLEANSFTPRWEDGEPVDGTLFVLRRL